MLLILKSLPGGQKPIEGSNPSLSAIRHVNSRRSRSAYCGSDEAGITSEGGPEAIETSLIGGSANRNSTPQLTEINHCVEITFLQDAVIDPVDVDEDRSEGVVARFRNAADLAIDLRDHGTL
jgi:hypothetical protein